MMNDPQNFDGKAIESLDAIGGEPLGRSGFEDEASEPEFEERPDDGTEEGAN